MIRIIIFLFALNLYANEFEFISSPADADVFVSKGLNESPVKIGKTPLKVTGEEIFRHINDQKTFEINIVKEGFDTYRMMMIKSEKANFKMDVKLSINNEIKTIKKHDLLISELFEVQRLIRANNYSDALTRLDQLEKDNKDFSIISELKGITYYMKKDINNALSMFRLAFGKNPKNYDAYKMKVYLEKKLGIDAEDGK